MSVNVSCGYTNVRTPRPSAQLPKCVLLAKGPVPAARVPDVIHRPSSPLRTALNAHVQGLAKAFHATVPGILMISVTHASTL